MSPRSVEEPVTAKYDKSAMFDTEETHPAYGQIGASRVHGDIYLYGSDFRHRNFVTISVYRSKLCRGLSSDHAMAGEELIEVALSEAQWASFVSSMNAGRGVQCTLLRTEREAFVPGLPAPKRRDEQFTGEMTETLADARARLAELRRRLVEGKGGKESLRLLDLAVQEIEKNTRFVAGQFGEHMEQTVERAKVEVNAYVQAAVTRAGLAALGAKPPLVLEGGDDGDGR